MQCISHRCPPGSGPLDPQRANEVKEQLLGLLLYGTPVLLSSLLEAGSEEMLQELLPGPHPVLRVLAAVDTGPLFLPWCVKCIVWPDAEWNLGFPQHAHGGVDFCGSCKCSHGMQGRPPALIAMLRLSQNHSSERRKRSLGCTA